MEYITVGKIINTHGIHGEIKIYPYTEDIQRFSKLKNAYIGKEKLHVKIQSVRYYKGIVFLKLKEYNSINEVLIFKGNLLYIDEKDKIKLPKDNYFLYQLIDCKVYDVTGNLLGYIKDVLQNSSNDVYVIKDKNKEYFIPAVKEFVKDVNIVEKKIIIDPIEGMIE